MFFIYPISFCAFLFLIEKMFLFKIVIFSNVFIDKLMKI